MLYYRYRSATEVGFKELLYSELFFTSSSECNDPFDSKTFFTFPKDEQKWRRLLDLCWKPFKDLNLKLPIEETLPKFLEACPATFEDLLNLNAASPSSVKNPSDSIFIAALEEAFKTTINLYKPTTRYFASFSRTRDEPLMWSHYADKHNGFCLIFKAIDGRLLQSHPLRKRSFHLDTPGGLANTTNFGLPESFEFSDIRYVSEVRSKNSFNCFPEFVAGPIASEETKINLIEEIQEDYYQKHLSWRYEEESRLTLSPPSPWLAGGHFDYSPQQRLFHYEPTQLVGLIFGSRTSPETKRRIEEIVETRMEWIAAHSEHKRVIFDFVTFQAHVAHDQRAIKISPTKIYSLSDKLTPDNPKFTDRLVIWESGFGLELHGSGAKRVCIK